MRNSIIFLDVDFVLNDSNTEERVGNNIGVDDDKISLLKEMKDILDADIVLSSSWKDFWAWTDDVRNTSDTTRFELGRYLDQRLREHGLRIADKTPSLSWRERASEIINWLENHPEVKRFVILDDEDFGWRRYGLDSYWLCTFDIDEIGYCGGLKPKHVEYIRNNLDQFAYTRSKY